MTRVFDISSLDDSPILGAPTEMAPRHWRFSQERARLRKSERAARMCERGAFFWMMAAVCAKYIVRAGSGSADMIQSANSMLNFTARAAAEISALSGSEPSAETGVLDPDRAALSARLRELCERVTGCGVDPSPMQAVAEILSLGEA